MNFKLFNSLKDNLIMQNKFRCIIKNLIILLKQLKDDEFSNRDFIEKK